MEYKVELFQKNIDTQIGAWYYDTVKCKGAGSENRILLFL